MRSFSHINRFLIFSLPEFIINFNIYLSSVLVLILHFTFTLLLSIAAGLCSFETVLSGGVIVIPARVLNQSFTGLL